MAGLGVPLGDVFASGGFEQSVERVVDVGVGGWHQGVAVVDVCLGRVDDARISKAKSDIRVLESSLELYKLDNFTYPSSDQGLQALVTRPSGDNTKNWRDGGYIKKLNKDPWGNEYQYSYPGSNAEFDVFSLGADAQVGGTGEAADIGNWNLDS